MLEEMVTWARNMWARETWGRTEQGPLVAGARYLLLSCVLQLFCTIASAQAPGGFIENQATSTRTRWTTAQILAFMPTFRDQFIFPAPYNTRAVRITDSSDCSPGLDCVRMVGYSYWRVSNAHQADPNFMWIFITLDPARGGSGPNLFRYDKVNHTILKAGPLFPVGSVFRNQDGEQWSFTNTSANELYINNGSILLRYNVVTQSFSQVYDAATQFGASRFIWQPHASADDVVHSAALYISGGIAQSNRLGCITYNQTTGQFRFFAKIGNFNECHIDHSGRYLLIHQDTNLDGFDDTTVVDLNTSVTTTILAANTIHGHSDVGYGYFIGLNGFGAFPRVLGITFSGSIPSVTSTLFRTANFSINNTNHLTHTNATAAGMASNFACGSDATAATNPQNEITCFGLSSTLPLRQLIVAPVMTNPAATGGGTGGGCFDNTYCKFPKGNLDITGNYFIWTSNLGGNRLDAFLVEVPYQLIPGLDHAAPVPPDFNIQ
jgi:hypothetical protein